MESGTGCAAGLLYVDLQSESTWAVVLGLQKVAPVKESPENISYGERFGVQRESGGSQKCHVITMYTNVHVF